MDSKTGMIFSYIINADTRGEARAFGSIKELRDCIKEANFLTPYTLKIFAFSKDEEVLDNPLSFLVADKLLYPKDLRQILNAKYGSVLNLENYKLDEQLPIKCYSVSERETIGINKQNTSAKSGDPKTKVPFFVDTHYILQKVHCEQVKPDDIIVNEKLYQIWPKDTGRVPYQLTNLLAQQKEIIR